MMVLIGSVYRLRDDDKALGDYSRSIVLIEAGPRGAGRSTQYRVSWGKNSWEVDWINIDLFDGATKIDNYDISSLVYSPKIT